MLPRGWRFTRQLSMRRLALKYGVLSSPYMVKRPLMSPSTSSGLSCSSTSLSRFRLKRSKVSSTQSLSSPRRLTRPAMRWSWLARLSPSATIFSRPSFSIAIRSAPSSHWLSPT